MHGSSLAKLLGYASDATLLIVNADDFGMCHAGNVATVEGLENGVYSSTTVMVPCPWFPDAVGQVRAHPEWDVGIHLTHTSEWTGFRWGPVAGASTVPSLVDEQGFFHSTFEAVYRHARLDEVERETRAQIETALAVGIDVTHLDSHMGVLQRDARYHELYVRIAAEYRLPIRMMNRATMASVGMNAVVELADRLGILMPDHFQYGGHWHAEDAVEYWSGVLRNLQPGVTDVYVHPAKPWPEIEALAADAAKRIASSIFFASSETDALLTTLGVHRIGYRPIRDLQRNLTPC